ncbi:MAG: PH domain-containing protein [Colwellia sp.]|nr:PH domain-containing protein [Colwellia sp.]
MAILSTDATQSDFSTSTQPEQANKFSNQAINTAQLPHLISLKLQPISPSYARANRYINLISTMVLMLIGLAIAYQPFIELSSKIQSIIFYVIWAVGALGLLSTVYGALADVRKFYALREQDISYCSGLIFRKTVSQPILRIQHVEVKRGPIDRKIGLANLQVFSAGGAMHTFEIPGLLLTEAESIRQFILSHKDTKHHE